MDQNLSYYLGTGKMQVQVHLWHQKTRENFFYYNYVHWREENNYGKQFRPIAMLEIGTKSIYRKTKY